ncbi:MAG: nitrilase-related carbon-nitrogen hydrolase [Weeping tea tree witches'-broom phytoplasma]|uniref:nitrilase-related carbon-nitrogen hydrolase n=1 Tax=Candidatus Phytoplasma melaleucae TaxID=2982630 RepID=UPI002939A255|nr:nitrilase-related carbon-nitrogen hydrolase [Weeping tea tree witches'-broom phytoplasma]
MYKNGFIKIELSNPNLSLGDTLANAKTIVNILNNSKASFVLFPELCLSGYTVGDFFFENAFYQENLISLVYILDNVSFEGVYLIGMPFILGEVIFNVAVVIQKKKILGIVPKQVIPNYKEFSEKRWFQSGKIIETQEVVFLEQKVPIGNILFVNQLFDISFGVEICQDLWTMESPSDLLTLNGAHLIFNLSASTEHIGKKELRRMAVVNHSRKQIGGYFYTSNGTTESSDDAVFSNHKIAAVLGEVIGEKDIFNTDTNLIVDVSIDAIKHQRKIDTTYADQKIGKNSFLWKSYFQIIENDIYEFERPFSKKPFLPQNKLSEQLKLSNQLQCLFLQNKLYSLENSRVVLPITVKFSDLITLLVVIQSFQVNKKPWDDLIVILDYYNDNKEFVILMKKFLLKSGIKNIINHSLSKDKTTRIKRNNRMILNYLTKLEKVESQCQKNIVLLENDNLSNISLGQLSPRLYNYDFIYNVNSGLSNTSMTELILFHFKQNTFSLSRKLKKFYLQQIECFLTEKVIIQDFILYYYLKYSFTKNKISFLIEKTFLLSAEKSLFLTEDYLTQFYINQYKRQQVAPGPKIFENSLSPRTELKLSVDCRRSTVLK